VLAAGLAAALFLAELVVGWVDPYGAASNDHNSRLYQSEIIQIDPSSTRLFRQRPNVDVDMWGYRFVTDAHGLRRTVAAPEPPEGRERCLFFLGDSVVLGWGVDARDTFVAGVERALCQRTGAAWRAVNSGHLMYDTTQELALLDEIGLGYAPDLVLLVYVDNDVIPTRGLFDLQTNQADLSEEAQRFLRRSARIAAFHPYLPNLSAVLQFMLVQGSPAGQMGAATHAKEVGLDLEEGWETSQAALGGIAARCEERGIPFAVLDHYRGTPLSLKLQAFCEERGIPHGCIAFTEEERTQDITNSRADAHANPLGHRLLTEKILSEIDRLGLLDDLPE
jgi:hypothetical protein